MWSASAQEADKGLQDASAAATAAAALLAGKPLRQLPAACILELLRFLCDQALDTERIRNVSPFRLLIRLHWRPTRSCIYLDLLCTLLDARS